jgi:secreted trypsin-like serine protease
MLVAVTSWGNGCAQTGYPGIYSTIADNIKWIKTIITQKVIKCKGFVMTGNKYSQFSCINRPYEKK